VSGLGNRGINGAQDGNRVPQYRQEGVHYQRYDRRLVAEAEDRDENPEQRKRRDGRKVKVIASATFAVRSLRYASTPSDTPITTAIASDMATTTACPMASSST